MTTTNSLSGSESRGAGTLLDLAAIFGRQKALMLGLPLALALLAIAVTYLMPVQFRANVAVATSPEATPALLKAIADSDAVRDKVIERFKLSERYGSPPGLPTATAYSGRVSSRATRENQLIISAVDTEPEFAANLANTVAAQTIEAANARRLSKTGQVLNLINLELQELGRRSAAARQLLEREGVKDWRTAFREGDASLILLAADLQAEISSQPQTPFDSSMLLMQERLLTLQRSATNRTGPTGGDGPPAVVANAAKDIAFADALGRRLKSRAEVLKGQLEDEIKIVAPAPVPLRKESPIRSIFAAAGLAAGLLLALVIAIARDSVARRRTA